MISPVLTTNRLTLCVPNAGDYETMASYYATDRSKWVGGLMSRTESFGLLASIIGHWALRGFGLFSVKVNHELQPCAMVGIGHPEGVPEPELSWAVWNTSHEGKGIAKEAAIVAREFYYNEIGGKSLVSYIHPDNVKSIALAEKLGTVVDTTAATPRNNNSIVYRHPAPEALL